MSARKEKPKKDVKGTVYKNGLTKKHYQIEFRTPGYGNGRFSMSSGVSDKKTRDDYLSKLRQIYQAGELAILDTVKDRKISLPVMKSEFDKGGIRGLIAFWQELQAEAAAASPELLPLVAAYRVDPSRAGAEKTKGDYDKQIHGFIEFVDVELNGPLKGKKAKPAESREPVRVKHIERDRVSRWVRHLETEGSHRYASREKLSPRTARHHRASLSALCGWLMEKGYLTDNPVSRAYKPRLAKTDPVYMTREQWALFRAECEAHDAERTMEKAEPDTTFWKFLAATGATTYNEGCAVRPTDIHVRQNPGSPMVRVWLGGTKSDNRPRSVWIARALAEEVLAYGKRWGRSPHEPVFQFERSDGYYRFKKIVKRLANAGHEGFDVMNPYTLRHTYAVAMIQGDPERGIPGVDIVTLARLMGHGDNITTTMIYARHVGDYAAMGCQNMATAMGLDR